MSRRPSSLPLDTIRIGKRHRKDMGDIAALAASMAEALFHPIVVTPDYLLIAGERRLLAAKQLGWKEISVTIVDLNEVARGEYTENTFRKDFTLSEAVAIKRALEPKERAAAKKRQVIGGKLKASANLAGASKGDARDKIAAFTGVKRTTLAKAEAIVDASAAEPEKFGKFQEAMDRTGRVEGVYRRLKTAQQAALIRAEPPPLPGRGPYRVGVADPPWPYEIRDEDPSHRGVRPYPSMSIEQICALDVASLMAKDAVLFLWTPNFHLVQGVATRVLRAWASSRRR